jgi:hypothetical protein
LTERTGEVVKLPHDWSREALLVKAQRYAEEMLSHPPESWLFPFWSTLTLELLARAALAATSPVLLAESRDWRQLQYALGMDPTASKFHPKSVAVSEVFERLAGVHPDLDPVLIAFAQSHMVHRNAELHSGHNPFEGMKESGWLPPFYRTCKAFLDILGEGLDSFFGEEDANLARELIAVAEDEGAKAVAKTIAAHRTIWEAKEEDERQELATQAKAWATRHVGHRVECPSCGSTAIVTGEAVSAPSVRLEDDLIVEAQYHLPSRLECTACGLKVGGVAQLNAAGVGDQYKATRTFEVAEYYELVDPHAEFEPDFNER